MFERYVQNVQSKVMSLYMAGGDGEFHKPNKLNAHVRLHQKCVFPRYYKPICDKSGTF